MRASSQTKHRNKLGTEPKKKYDARALNWSATLIDERSLFAKLVIRSYMKRVCDFVLPVLVGAVAQHLSAVALGRLNGNLHFGKLPAMPCKKPVMQLTKE